MAQAAISAPGGAHAEAPPAGLTRPDFQIVPRAGLPIVAVVLALTIAGIASDKLWPLIFLHVVGGAAWTIIDLFLGFVLGPIMGQLSIPARIEFTTRLMPKMVLIMPTVVTVTLAAGWQLSTHLGTNLTGNPLHGWVVASFIVVGVMAVIALGLLEPANIAVLTELKKPQPNPAVIERLMKRFIYTAGATGLMQIATLVIMTKLAPDERARAGRRRARGARVGACRNARLPPVTALGMLSLALVLVGGIYLSAHLPEHVPLGPAVALLAASVVVLLGNVLALSRVKGFAWGSFFAVAKWALLAYAIIAAMIEYVFLRNDTSGGPLVVLTLSLVVFALNVPLLIGFTVARYAQPDA